MSKFCKERHIQVRIEDTGKGISITPFEGKKNLKVNKLVCAKTKKGEEDGKDGKDGLYKEGLHLLLFRIHDRDKTGLRFQAKPTDAFWAKAVADGATSGPTSECQTEQCVPLLVSEQGQLLIVANLNTKALDIGYTLRLVDEAGNGHDCDPIIGNANGGESAEFLPNVNAPAPTTGAVILGVSALIAGLGYALAASDLFATGRRGKHK
jgi:hypothetical protein